jgi:mannosyltransferase OCH1-like enzyme
MKLKLVIILLLILVLIRIFFRSNNQDNFESGRTNEHANKKDFVKQESITDINLSKSRNLNQIPKIIIQTWKSNEIPIKYSQDIKSVRALNPNFEYLFFTDEDIDTFIKTKYPIWYSTYLKLPIKIQKIDFFRYIAVYHFGGFYLDLDMTCLKPFDTVLNSNCVFPVDQHITNCNLYRFKDFCSKNINFLLGQYAFGAKPKHPFIKLLIDKIHKNLDIYIEQEKKLIPNDSSNFNLYVYRSTGPDFVTNVYLEYPDAKNIDILPNSKNQYFGEYAKHNFYGTWK